MCRLRNITMRDYQESVTTKIVWLPDGRTDRRRTKWSLCAAMLRRRHKNSFKIRKLELYTFASFTQCSIVLHTLIQLIQICPILLYNGVAILQYGATRHGPMSPRGIPWHWWGSWGYWGHMSSHQSLSIHSKSSPRPMEDKLYFG